MVTFDRRYSLSLLSEVSQATQVPLAVPSDMRWNRRAPAESERGSVRADGGQ